MFKDFCRKYDIEPHKSSPWYPSSNSQAEHLVRSLKPSLKGQKTEICNAYQKWTNFYSSIGMRVHQFKYYIKMDLLKPNLRQSVEQKQYNPPRIQDRFHTFYP